MIDVLNVFWIGVIDLSYPNRDKITALVLEFLRL